MLEAASRFQALPQDEAASHDEAPSQGQAASQYVAATYIFSIIVTFFILQGLTGQDHDGWMSKRFSMCAEDGRVDPHQYERKY